MAREGHASSHWHEPEPGPGPESFKLRVSVRLHLSRGGSAPQSHGAGAHGLSSCAAGTPGPSVIMMPVAPDSERQRCHDSQFSLSASSIEVQLSASDAGSCGERMNTEWPRGPGTRFLFKFQVGSEGTVTVHPAKFVVQVQVHVQVRRARATDCQWQVTVTLT
eukprot:1644602-Rhodomonas_salina.1